MQILIIMAVWALHTIIFVLMTIAMTAQSTNHIAQQAVYQKLEHALTTDSKARYLMQRTFFPPQRRSLDIVFIHVNITVNSTGVPESCGEHHPLPDKLINFSYQQKFQWTSSPLLNLISVDQLLILDNIISERICQTLQHYGFLHITLHIDTLPCNTSEDDLLEALMQLLTWVSTSVFACVRH